MKQLIACRVTMANYIAFYARNFVPLSSRNLSWVKDGDSTLTTCLNLNSKSFKVKHKIVIKFINLLQLETSDLIEFYSGWLKPFFILSS